MNILLMQNIQTAASVLTHSAKPHSRILPQRGIRMEQNCTIPDDNEIETLAELFKIFGDTTRIRILFALCGEERNVSGIAEALDMTQSAVSHQLKILRTARLIRARRDGKQIYYSLADEHVHTIIGVGREHIEE